MSAVPLTSQNPKTSNSQKRVMMQNFVIFMILLLMPLTTLASRLATQAAVTPAANTAIPKELQRKLIGSPVYIQIFKEEGLLELYVQLAGKYQLLKQYPVCKFSGGLGPKRLSGDFKSPEGFYTISQKKLNSNSQFHKSMDIGFPNAYDRAHGYTGSYLMIHGACVSVGCYAMTDHSIDEIFHYVQSALATGQSQVAVSIYPFRMTSENMQRHKYSSYLSFWKQLKPGYDYFLATQQPPAVIIHDGRYVVASAPTGKASLARLDSAADSAAQILAEAE